MTVPPKSIFRSQELLDVLLLSPGLVLLSILRPRIEHCILVIGASAVVITEAFGESAIPIDFTFFVAVDGNVRVNSVGKELLDSPIEDVLTLELTLAVEVSKESFQVVVVGCLLEA